MTSINDDICNILYFIELCSRMYENVRECMKMFGGSPLYQEGKEAVSYVGIHYTATI